LAAKTWVHDRVHGAFVKNRNKKILQFPTPPEEPLLTTVIFQVGSTRFAMHWSIEALPPAELQLRLVPQVNQINKRIHSSENIAAAPENSKP